MESNKENHKKLWTWLAEHPKCEKDDYFDVMGIPEEDRPESNCYACEEDSKRNLNKEVGYCKCCPLMYLTCSNKCLSGLYDKWRYERNLQKRSALALQISNLEWR